MNLTSTNSTSVLFQAEPRLPCSRNLLSSSIEQYWQACWSNSAILLVNGWVQDLFQSQEGQLDSCLQECIYFAAPILLRFSKGTESSMSSMVNSSGACWWLCWLELPHKLIGRCIGLSLVWFAILMQNSEQWHSDDSTPCAFLLKWLELLYRVLAGACLHIGAYVAQARNTCHLETGCKRFLKQDQFKFLPSGIWHNPASSTAATMNTGRRQHLLEIVRYVPTNQQLKWSQTSSDDYLWPHWVSVGVNCISTDRTVAILGYMVRSVTFIVGRS